MTSWAIWQYRDAEKGEGIVMALRRPDSLFENAKITLCSVTGAMIQYERLDTGDTLEGSSELEMTISEKKSSAIIKYKTKAEI